MGVDIREKMPLPKSTLKATQNKGRRPRRKKTFILNIAKMGRGTPLPKLILKLLIFEAKTKVKKLPKLLVVNCTIFLCYLDVGSKDDQCRCRGLIIREKDRLAG